MARKRGITGQVAKGNLIAGAIGSMFQIGVFVLVVVGICVVAWIWSAPTP